MLFYTGSFFLCWIIVIVILNTPLCDVPAFKIVAGVLTPLQGFFNMVIFFCPECLKYQKYNPGTRLFVAYVRVVIRTPAWVEAIRKMFLPSQTATPNTDV